MTFKRILVSLYRLVIVFLVISGTHDLWAGHTSNAVYFTYQSNIVLGAIMLWAGLATLLNGVQPPAWLKGCLTLYIMVTGLVANLLLPPSDPASATYVFGITTSTIMHIIVPILAVLDFIFCDPHRRYKWHYALTWLIYFPVYLAFVIIRANAYPHSGPGYGADPTNPYPYGFVDLNKLGWFGHDGSLGLAQNIGIYLAAFFVLGLIVFAIDRLLPSRALISTIR